MTFPTHMDLSENRVTPGGSCMSDAPTVAAIPIMVPTLFSNKLRRSHVHHLRRGNPLHVLHVPEAVRLLQMELPESCGNVQDEA
jgi:hypothetical protein